MSGIDLLIIGRQVQTGYGGYIDLLGLDADGRAHVLELKRDRTPRDAVAQALDYGSWVKDLSLEDLEQLYLDHHGDETKLDEAFAERFGSPLPNVVNADQQFMIVASELDPTSDRIVEFLAESYGEWLATRPLDQAVWEKGLFASQITACKLRDEHTIKTVESAFGFDTAID